MNDAAHSRDTLDAAVWNACEAFRGTVAPDVCKDYVLTMLFLKHISDVWQARCDDYEKAHGDHPGLIEELLKNERFVLPPNASFHALHAARHRPGNGERIDKALHAIEEANLAKLRDVFQGISFDAAELGDEAHKDDLLRRLLEDFARPAPALDESRIGDACDVLIGRLAASGDRKSGDFHSPPEVSQLIARLMTPQPGDEICDPACGSGSLLIACAQRIRAQTGSRRYALYGQEAAGSIWAMARMNLFMHAEDNHRIAWGDTLRHPKLLDSRGQLRRFDIVVADAPFSLERWGHDAAGNDPHQRFRRGLPPRTRGDYAFVLHMVETMKAGTGRMAVVVPHGVLFRGAAEGKIRQKLIEENLLDVVIGLPEKLFHGTGIPAAILVLRRNKTDDKVLFVDASRACQEGKNQNQLRAGDVDAIVATVAARESVAKYAHLARLEEIAGNDFNLNISRYVDTFEGPVAIDLVALAEERSALKAELAMLEESMAKYMKALGHA